MPLTGTLDTLSVAEVLSLLESGKKSGVLAVRGDSGESQLALLDGALVDGIAPGLPTEARSDQEREAILIDVCFDMIRQSNGEFQFRDSEVVRKDGQTPFAVGDIVRPAMDAAAEWVMLSKVIPDMLAPLVVQTQLSTDSVGIDRDSWSVLMRMNGRKSVTELAAELRLSRISTARLVRPLVEQGIVLILAKNAGDVAEQPAEKPVGKKVEAAKKKSEKPAEDQDEDSGSDRGAILRMFSSLRDD